MAKAIRDSKRVAKRPRAQSKMSYEDPATFPDVFGIQLMTDHFEPEYPKGCFLVIDKRLPCRRGDMVAIYPTEAAAGARSSNWSIKFLHTQLSESVNLPVRMHPESEVGFCLLVADSMAAEMVQVWDVQKMQAMYRIARIAVPEELDHG